MPAAVAALDLLHRWTLFLSFHHSHESTEVRRPPLGRRLTLLQNKLLLFSPKNHGFKGFELSPVIIFFFLSFFLSFFSFLLLFRRWRLEE